MYVHRTIAAGLFSAAVALTVSPASGATQDHPVVEHGLTTVCTGVGSSKADSRWGSYPVKLVFSNSRGQYVADEHVKLLNGEHTVMQTVCDAPWLLLRVPAGHYRVSASLVDAAGTRRAEGQFSTAPSDQGQKTVTLEFPVTNQRPVS